MKIHPITNGTPENSLEFAVSTEKSPGDLQPIWMEILGEDGPESFVTSGWSQTGFDGVWVCIFGPAFKTLAAAAGPMHDAIRRAHLQGERLPVNPERPRTARELCRWLEEQLTSITTKGLV